MVVAAHDLPAGHTLTTADLRSASWPADAAPPARLASAVGGVLATPIRAGELVTDVRVIGPGLLDGQPPGIVAVPVRLGDASTSAFVRAGDRVDVLAAASSDWSAAPDQADGTDLPDGTAPDPAAGSSPGSSSTGASGSIAERLVSGALVLAVAGETAETGSGSGSGQAQSGDGGTGGSGLSSLGGIGADSDSGTAPAGSATGVIVLAVTSAEASRLTAAQTGRFIAIAVLPPG